MVNGFPATSPSTDGTVQTIIDVGDGMTWKNYAFEIYAQALVDGEWLQVVTYGYDATGLNYYIHHTEDLYGPVDEPFVWFHYIASTKYKVTIQRMSGADRTYNYARVESP